MKAVSSTNGLKRKVTLSISGMYFFTYETDKAVFEEEAKVAGILLEIFHAEGDDVYCLEIVCVIGSVDEDLSAFTSGSQASIVKEEYAAKEKKVEAPITEIQKTATISAADMISPRARNLAQKN